MENERPNPEVFLKQIANQEAQNSPKGKLKIFFGYAAGVGKTFAMLQAAHEAKNAGVDVIVGYVEPHTRPQTLELLEGLEILPVIEVEYKDIKIKEFDIDGAIKRSPKLILVDELAHTNAKGSRHLKRYQDIEELLNAGVDVYTTVNVQHIESLNDTVESITGIAVRERIPDFVFDNADQIKLIDIEPDDLIERLNSGKIYKKNQAQKALINFFTKENLIALNEIALRRTADRVNIAVEKNKALANKFEYFTAEHILVCLSSSPSNPKVIRTAAKMADVFHCTLTALFVETPQTTELSEENQARLRENIKLAEQLGAKITTVYGNDVPYQVSQYAKTSGVSKIVIGRSGYNRRLIFPQPNFIDKLIAHAPNLDIYVIPDKPQQFFSNNQKHCKKKFTIPRFSPIDTIKSAAILALSTLVGFWFYELHFSESNIITIYILGVLFTALATEGKLYSITSSLFAVLLFNFFFTDPRFSFEASNPGYPVTFVVMFISAFLISTLAKRSKEQAFQSSLKVYSTEVLLETSQKLQRAKDKNEIFNVSVQQIEKLLELPVILYPVINNALIEPIISKNETQNNDEIQNYLTADEYAVAQWVCKNNKQAGATTNTLSGAKCLCMPIGNNDTVFAVVAIAVNPELYLNAFEKNLLVAMLRECAIVLEKENITETKNSLAIKAEQEQLRFNLLRAISHDLRTPLTSISGNANILINNSQMLDEAKKQQLYADIYDDSIWLIDLMENSLSITRIDNGDMNIKMEPELLDEVITEALSHVRKGEKHNIKVDLKDDMLMAKMDSCLIIQVIINIVDNAIKYTKPGSNIIISAKKNGNMVEVEISDDGDGINDDAKSKIFDMFFTTGNNVTDSRRGLGLGLALCKSIITAHGGEISAKDNIPKGTIFRFTLQNKVINSRENNE